MIKIVGAGLAGCEAANYLASHGQGILRLQRVSRLQIHELGYSHGREVSEVRGSAREVAARLHKVLGEGMQLSHFRTEKQGE